MDTPIFFTDRNLGKAFPTILRDAGLIVERHDDHFPPSCPDEIWLRDIGNRGWIAVTQDHRIRYKPNELSAVIQYRVRLLIVIGNAKFPELARNFVATRSRVLHFIVQHVPPYIAKVYRASATDLANDPNTPGRIERWYPAKD